MLVFNPFSRSRVEKTHSKLQIPRTNNDLPTSSDISQDLDGLRFSPYILVRHDLICHFQDLIDLLNEFPMLLLLSWCSSQPAAADDTFVPRSHRIQPVIQCLGHSNAGGIYQFLKLLLDIVAAGFKHCFPIFKDVVRDDIFASISRTFT
jgi:hypothetical protein